MSTESEQDWLQAQATQLRTRGDAYKEDVQRLQKELSQRSMERDQLRQRLDALGHKYQKVLNLIGNFQTDTNPFLEE